MLRLPTRAVARSAQSSLAPARTTFGRRFLTTDPPHLRSRSWKSSAARWGIAIAGIYYYNTSPIFAEQPGSNLLNPNLEALDEEASGTSLEALTSRQRRQQRDKSVLESAAEAASTENASTSAQLQLQPGSPEQLEEEADQQGAFNPETGEINWDCPCLGGMAHGPCGPEFREAFSCFVYSTEEPKGMECIDKFQGMQTCFQKHPDIYQSELMDDEDEGTMDEGMKAEREELAKEIKERREKLGTAEDTPPQRRLLEEPEAAPVKAATTKVTPNARTAPSETQKPTRTPKAPGSASPASPAKSTEKPMPEAKLNIGAGQPSEHEDLNEGQSSQLIREPAPSPVQSSTSMGFGDEVGELVPKAAHDASDAKALDQEKKA